MKPTTKQQAHAEAGSYNELPALSYAEVFTKFKNS